MRVSRLFSETVPVEELGAAEKEAMYALLAENYENVNRCSFEADLFEKDCAILLRDTQDHALRGFSTQEVMRLHLDGQPLRAVFSGDTIIARSHWGEQELGLAWGHFVAELGAEEPEVPLNWFLISKGYRTYLFLPLFFHQFFPRYDQVTPAHEQRILDALAGTRYPDSYVRESGLIVFPESHGNLSRDLAEIPAHRLRSPHVRFFLSRNSRFAEGQELACVAEISAANMRSYGSRILSESAGKPCIQNWAPSMRKELCFATANGMWLASFLPAHLAFRRAVRNPEHTQAAMLEKLSAGRKTQVRSKKTGMNLADMITVTLLVCSSRRRFFIYRNLQAATVFPVTR